MIPRMMIPAVVIACLGLAACGKQGQLDRPAPLFGAKAKAEYEAQRRAAARASSDTPSGSSQTNGDYSQGADGGSKDPALAPIRSNPIPGATPDPFGSRTEGVLPDPYADPTRSPR
jgi:hypothetical protein